ncbi:flagellar protein [Ruegeria marisrubri]|uniref:Flagellar protein n=1 Tax=Ruegeria marisrubri TaxID=1685379 RepID=A0A0X3TS79_9RHOB|nr:DUF1217 domain-containing protein [Ruegeria marisrubri]KUJ77901.1 flagellar protein [Ruegeria marisrubri]
MSFQPVIPATGLVGWHFLKRTYDAQLEVFSGTPQNERDTRYFLDNIGKVKTAESLVSDRRLLRVALTAFGLEDDLANTYFIRRVLQDGFSAQDALSSRLSDKRYKQLASAFGFGPGEVVKTGQASEMAQIAHRNLVSRFEVAVGQTDEAMRIALFARRTLTDLARKNGGENAKWFELMSLPPLRDLMETALGLPKAFAQLDIDKQLEMFRDKLARQTGSPDISQFQLPEAVDRLMTTFFARAQAPPSSLSSVSARTALQLLQYK